MHKAGGTAKTTYIYLSILNKHPWVLGIHGPKKWGWHLLGAVNTCYTCMYSTYCITHTHQGVRGYSGHYSNVHVLYTTQCINMRFWSKDNLFLITVPHTVHTFLHLYIAQHILLENPGILACSSDIQQVNVVLHGQPTDSRCRKRLTRNRNGFWLRLNWWSF